MWKILDFVFTVWLFGGWAVALLALALSSWRAGLATLAVWLISLIITAIWWLSQPSTPAVLSGESQEEEEEEEQ